MNKLTSSARLLLAASLLVAAGWAGAAIPLQRWTQPSGAEVYLVESPGIPMVDVQIDFDAGSRRDPAAQAGLANATAGQANKGIAAQGKDPALDENALGEAWADLGASFGASAGRDRMSFSLRSLTYPDLLPKAAALAARQLGTPAFDGAVWQRDRERIGAALRESYTRPGTVAGRTFQELVYSGHPYGRETTEQTLAAISVDDLRSFYAQTVLPCRAKVSVVGAVTRKEADQLVRTLLSRLPQARCAPLPAVAEVPALAKAEERRIPFASNQAQVLIGQPGIKRDDPDFFAVLVGNHILGAGGFVSRLTHEVREKRGLTYGVSSDFSPGRHAGAFTIGLQTRTDQADAAIAVARETLARFVAEGPTEQELKAAKDNLVGGFALRLDSNRKLLGNVSNIAWNGLPLDYLDNWTQRVEAVTVAQIRAAFARMLQPERMVTVVVGGA
ncbi:pitrilysin family protein [Pseudorhodoferax sp. Leaf274]|uniref:M16 family metallopeptidase n=1 Tax=Pseudorhodoferax sp. Leaf274 TaxID=1736318 RepID=UPI000703A4A6|nr:pitrilysin family protein [Pseudorhodoferax sp. Leaf274]KQP48633.1 zinc protease [Pseudorhodoferax sp. Leaf274]